VAAPYEPAAVMERRPAPGIVADPSPAVVVFPSPPAITIRRPVRANIRGPDVSILRLVNPAAVVIQILGAIDIGTYILITTGTSELAVATLNPTVELIKLNRTGHLKLAIRRASSHDNGATWRQILNTARAIDLSLTGAHGDLGLASFIN